jgi:hypothetical protein
MTQEPIAYINVEKRRLEFASPYVKWDTPTTIKLDRIPLFTQRTWVGLTDKQTTQLIKSMPRGIKGLMIDWDLYDFSKAIEAKLKEKNT